MMPKQTGGSEINTSPASDAEFEEGTEFTFTITPGTEWYAVGIVPGQGMVPGENGQPLTFTTSVLKTVKQGVSEFYLRPVLGAAESLPPNDDSPIITINITRRADT